MAGTRRLRGIRLSRRLGHQGATSRAAVSARRSYRPWSVGTSFGTLRPPVARSRSSRVAATQQEVCHLQEFPVMARPGLEPGTPRFSAVVSSRRPRSAPPERSLPFAPSSTLPARARARARTRTRVEPRRTQAQVPALRGRRSCPTQSRRELAAQRDSLAARRGCRINHPQIRCVDL